MSAADTAAGYNAVRLAIRASIQAQGVPVPSDVRFTEFPDYIAAIESGEPPVPSEPAAFTSGQWTATAGVEEIDIDVDELPDDGGSVITALQYRLDGGAAANLPGTGTGVRTITGLTGGVEYDIQIRAVNAVDADPANWSDTKSRTPSASGGGGTPGEMTFGNNSDDTDALTAGFFNQYANTFFAPGVDNLVVDTPDAKATDLRSVTMLSPDLTDLPAGATINIVEVEGVVLSRWLTPTAHVYRCLRPVEIASSSIPGITNYATGLAWAGESASGAGDKSASLSSAVVPSPGSPFTIPSSSGLVAAVQAWASGPRSAPLWLILGSTGSGDDSFEFRGNHLDNVDDGERIRMRIGYTV